MADITVVSNRLPVIFDRNRSGGWDVHPGQGGLVQALTPILRRRGGRWVGWSGIRDEDRVGDPLPVQRASDAIGLELEPVNLSASEVQHYYGGFSNSALWPLFHGFPERCTFEAREWEAYQGVNGKFAEAVIGAPDSDAIWVHDYHLIPLANHLRARGASVPIGFFLHTPFPPMQLFITLPWRGELLRALLAYDLVGFQTARDCRNFLDCVERLMPEADVAINGSAAINTPAGRTSAGIFPIGIAADAWRKRATSAAVDTIAGKLRSELEGRRVILGVDRLDYSKGLLQRLHAFERMLEQDPTLHERVVLIQLQIPSRESVGEYQLLKREIEGAVGRITGRFATPTWAPIRYMYTSVDPNTLAALYRIADVGLVTSLIDGMNLVSKEFCACQVDDPGVLVLSETAGAACQLADGAILVNPHDIERTAEALRTALNMSRSERGERMSVLWNTVRASNVFAWADDYVNALLSADRHAPLDSDEYLPILAPPSQLGFRG